jgi:hypothetical protein
MKTISKSPKENTHVMNQTITASPVSETVSPVRTPKCGQITPDHPFYFKHHKLACKGTLVKRGLLSKRATWTGLGGDYVIAKLPDDSDPGYVAIATITTRWDTNYGLFVSRGVSEDAAYFLKVSDCMPWIKRRAKSRLNLVE